MRKLGAQLEVFGRNDSKTRFVVPRGHLHRRLKRCCCDRHLCVRQEPRLGYGHICANVGGKLRRVISEESILGYFEVARRNFALLRLRQVSSGFPDIRVQRVYVNQCLDLRICAGHCDDGTTVTMAHEDYRP